MAPQGHAPAKKKMLEMLELLIVKSQFVLDDMELDIRHGIE